MRILSFCSKRLWQRCRSTASYRFLPFLMQSCGGRGERELASARTTPAA
jgi:hypothetical protein